MARRAWSLLTTLLETQKRAFEVEAERIGLTQVSAYALYMLSDLPPGPIAQLATKLSIDPGWATIIVDKLEERGAVRRRASETDRRVRVVEVTPTGARLVAQIRDLALAPAPLTALPERDLRVLVRIAERAMAAVSAAPGHRAERSGTSRHAPIASIRSSPGRARLRVRGLR